MNISCKAGVILLKSLEKDYFSSFVLTKFWENSAVIYKTRKETFLGINLYIKRTIRRMRESESY